MPNILVARANRPGDHDIVFACKDGCRLVFHVVPMHYHQNETHGLNSRKRYCPLAKHDAARQRRQSEAETVHQYQPKPVPNLPKECQDLGC